MKLLNTNTKISFIKFIRNIPSDSSEFAPFLNQRVKETKSVEKFLPGRLKVVVWMCIRLSVNLSVCVCMYMPVYDYPRVCLYVCVCV